MLSIFIKVVVSMWWTNNLCSVRIFGVNNIISLLLKIDEYNYLLKKMCAL
jgi:hypothetical protein